ncbi:anti-sigma factor [Aureispira sp. CCB-E]|uniref:anti-sigma factor n=1 Tax=Aureispira sp. CCB-E TaxID=3051121 RepID=UPI0028691D3A|nr:anti-sigma factor [Aureispira sp. CCB-E]WMX13634.1 anti-sigma factor [Aureispira sp. CCB-E]
MRITNFLLIALVSGLFILTGCQETPITTNNFTVSIAGLEDLGNDYVYEGWLIVNGTPVSTGTFTVNNTGVLSQTSFEADISDLDNATKFVLSIEPSVDSDPAPSAVKILAGDFSNNTATLSVGDGAALGNDFSTAAGSYILATPTDALSNNENSGVWWLVPGGTPSLTLPTLPSGWRYEGWAVVNGMPLSTGTFTNVSGADDAAPYSGPNAGPAFPGEDFLTNAPSGITFPLDLSNANVVISVEPFPDNSEKPFLLKPLAATVPANATNGTSYNMNNNNTTNPSGTVTRP